MNSEELQLLPFSAFDSAPVPIAYRFLKPQDNKPAFFWFSGLKSEMAGTKAEAIAAWARQHGAGCLRFDYSGHGQSGGRFEDGTISSWLGQAGALYDQLLETVPTVFVGSSMGGWIALLLARRLMTEARRTPFGIVLIAPAWDMTALLWDKAPEEARASIGRHGVWHRPSAYGDEPYAITEALIEDGARHGLANSSFELKIPIRIVHGCEDPDIPWAHSLSLLSLVGSPDVRLTLVKDGEHRLSRPKDLSLLYATLTEFL